MSTAPAQVRTDAAKKPKKTSSWANLRGLVPYLGRYKGAIAFGMVTLALMGIAFDPDSQDITTPTVFNRLPAIP